LAPIHDSIGFASVSLTSGAYAQLPDIPCDEITIGVTSANIQVANSATPGTNFMVVNNTTEWTIPTGGNANNLYLSLVTGGSTTIAFMWRLKGLTGMFQGV